MALVEKKKTETLQVIIADNQELTRIGITTVLSRYFNKNIAFEYVKDKDELFAKLKTDSFQALIIDFDMLDFKEIAELAEVRKIAPSTGVLVVTDNQAPDDVMRVLDCGIINIILKTCEEQELIEAFNATLTNRKFFSNEILEVLLERKTVARQKQETGRLTTSETDIVRLIAQGLTTKEIAQQKHLSFHTIITHRKNIFRKLSISNASELFMYAMRSGIVDSTEYYI